ncbi:hypothetical protein MUK42_35514 [Musa troglodytarum]|uniref:Uncharacterized protein n=1 Tax=Musa troglodytarum TaxID=320322 RepID=A0A9E7JBF0_9LILI|nr:hypothetical protein MUK42_35514 [Musa troglodytarum]
MADDASAAAISSDRDRQGDKDPEPKPDKLDAGAQPMSLSSFKVARNTTLGIVTPIKLLMLERSVSDVDDKHAADGCVSGKRGIFLVRGRQGDGREEERRGGAKFGCAAGPVAPVNRSPAAMEIRGTREGRERGGTAGFISVCPGHKSPRK